MPLTIPRQGAHVRAALPLAFALLMAVLALGLMRGSLLSLGNLNLPGPLFVPTPDPCPVVVTPPRRVLAILVDGLRADTARRLPFIGQLWRGAGAEVRAEMPTYSSAQYVSVLTGVLPMDSGVRGNVGLLRTPLDSVPARVRASGRISVEISDDVDWWVKLFGNDWTRARNVPVGQAVTWALPAMRDADFLWVHLVAVDETGHIAGVADPRYEEAARAADDAVRQLALAWGYPDATVAVLSDHGHHWPRGGHGGAEEDVRATFFAVGGPGVLPGGHVSGARAIDVAPTLAALLGVPAPAQAQGRTLVELLPLDGAARASLIRGDVVRQTRVAASVHAGRRGLLRAERYGQLLRGAAVALCLALATWLAARATPRARLGLLVGATSLVLTTLLYLVVFESFSFSADRDASTLAISTIDFGFTVCALTFAWPAVEVIRRRLTASAACALAFMAVLGASPAAIVMFVLCGADSPRITCEPAWLAAGPLLAYAALIPVALSAGALAALAGLIAARSPAPRP